MHRLPKIFTHKSDRRKSSTNSSLSSQAAARPQPKLDRCNAAKNINYEYSPASTSASSSSSSYFSSDESLRTRSLELYGGKTSFRIDGVEGEIEILCKILGFSGIEDFAIPEEEYAAMKMRSSSAPVVLSKTSRPLFDRETEVNYDSIDVVNRTSGAISTTCEEIRVSGENVSSDGHISFCSRLENNLRASDVVSSDNIGVRLNEFRGNGIKGVRPPVLVPPPLISLPVIDKDCSTWDMFRAFAPDSTTSCSRFEREVRLNGDEERTGEKLDREGNDDAEEEDRRGRGTKREENYVLSESYSFTTSSNDDSSRTTTPMSSNSPNRRFRCVIEGWQKGELLGRGSFGSVYEGIADDGFFFAVKEVSLLDQEDDGKQRILQLEQEIALLSQFEHENIVRYYGTKKDESHLYIFLELVTKGSLLSLYRKYCLKDSQVSAYTRQILHGLKYLHDKDVVHRDIKCANILVDTNGLVKLADFGLAKATKLNDVKSCKGTPFWMAPEVVRSLGYGHPADIWSLGCTVLEMLTRSFPYSNLECMTALFKIGRGERPPIPGSLSSDARDFILNCLQVDPYLRPTASQLLDHPFMKRPLPQSSGSASPHYFSWQN